ncbi:DUF2975 domain-containing protein [Maridesulfovibrio zosterae]|uniref:DUF2975 domain-containing protein n=1 Tax=Maridesulfovibrio zosterae TaxID=82171 RepID=UPI00048579C8|nr:DUF2975 domain-containing protein [Maridesulfovibrio zosterae]
MEKIKKISILLKYAFLVTLIIIPLFEVCAWVLFNGSYDSFFIPEFLVKSELYILSPLSDMQKALGLAASAPYILLSSYSIWQMVKLFTLYSHGKIFTAENSACYRRAAWALLIGEIVYSFSLTAVILVVTMNNKVGERLLVFGFDDANIGNIVIACVVLAISWVMDEGRKLQDEAELTI